MSETTWGAPADEPAEPFRHKTVQCTGERCFCDETDVKKTVNVRQTIVVEYSVPFDDLHYPDMSIADALQYERDDNPMHEADRDFEIAIDANNIASCGIEVWISRE